MKSVPGESEKMDHIYKAEVAVLLLSVMASSHLPPAHDLLSFKFLEEFQSFN